MPLLCAASTAPLISKAIRKASVNRQGSAKRLPFDVLHYQEVGTHIMESANVRMVQSRNGPGLYFEALEVAALQNLDGNGTPKRVSVAL